MPVDRNEALDILRRTPRVLNSMLGGISESWTVANEGPETWSVFDIVGHLIHGEETDWLVRMRIILAQGESTEFEPFDRFAQFEASRGKSMADLLAEFESARVRNIAEIEAVELTPDALTLEGLHPELGRVTLGQLLATWAVHDLGHLAQIARVMAKRWGPEVGPWRKYLTVLRDREGSS